MVGERRIAAGTRCRVVIRVEDASIDSTGPADVVAPAIARDVRALSIDDSPRRQLVGELHGEGVRSNPLLPAGSENGNVILADHSVGSNRDVRDELRRLHKTRAIDV